MVIKLLLLLCSVYLYEPQANDIHRFWVYYGPSYIRTGDSWTWTKTTDYNPLYRRAAEAQRMYWKALGQWNKFGNLGPTDKHVQADDEARALEILNYWRWEKETLDAACCASDTSSNEQIRAHHLGILRDRIGCWNYYLGILP